MLDQSFSGKNFNTIFLKELRKGRLSLKISNAEYDQKQQDIRDLLSQKQSLKKEKRTLSKKELDEFSAQIENLNREKEKIRISFLNEISDEINSKQFKFTFELDKERGIFKINKSKSSFFALKQLQENLSRTFKVKQANRHFIIRQLYQTLNNPHPKVILKTDIKTFYESIPHDRLFEKLDNNTLLTAFSKKLIKKLCFEFEQIKAPLDISPQRGLPRGISVSASLSELYMRDIDNSIKELDEVIFYSRYVDDIIVIFSPKDIKKCVPDTYLNKVRQIVIANSLELKEDPLNSKENKTHLLNLTDISSAEDTLQYLGYKFKFTPSNFNKQKNTFSLPIEISDKKKDKYKERLIKSINDYNTSAKFNEKRARKVLISRLKFLTGNFRLDSKKSSVKSGIYYSNEAISLYNKDKINISLKELNYSLCKLLMKDLYPPEYLNKRQLIKKLLSKHNFIDGFYNREKHFHSFSYEKGQYTPNNFWLIKSIWS